MERRVQDRCASAGTARPWVVTEVADPKLAAGYGSQRGGPTTILLRERWVPQVSLTKLEQSSATSLYFSAAAKRLAHLDGGTPAVVAGNDGALDPIGEFGFNLAISDDPAHIDSVNISWKY